MENHEITLETLTNENTELVASCRLWMAVAEAAQQRVAELEAENLNLQRRVARLARRDTDVSVASSRPESRRRTAGPLLRLTSRG